MDVLGNEGTVHHELVASIEALTKRNLVAYTSLLGHPASTIIDEDAGILEMLLKSIDLSAYPDTLDLVLTSPGGSPTAAEIIILTCRNYANSFRVIVPRTAMSAATLVAMGSDEILMSETAEIGPIDPQMVVGTPGQQALRPAISFIDSYTDLINKTNEALKHGQPPHAYLELLKRHDPAWIQICIKARQLSRAIASEYLTKYMLKGKNPSDIAALVEIFLKEGEQLSHGRAIRAEKAKAYGLNVDVMARDSELAQRIWELSVRCDHYVQQRTMAKYFVGRVGGVNVHVQKIAI